MLSVLLRRMDEEVEPRWRAAQGQARAELGNQYRRVLREMIAAPTVLHEIREIERDTPEWRVLQLLQGSAWAPLMDLAYAAEISREEAGAALRALHRFGFNIEIREGRNAYEYRLTQPVEVDPRTTRWTVEATPRGIMLRAPANG